MKQSTLAAATLLLMGCTTNNNTMSDSMIDELYNRMTQQERIAQLRSTYLNNYFTEDGKLDTAKCKAELSDGIGHFSQFASQQSEDPNKIRDRVAVMQEWLMNNTPSGIPALFHEEVLSGINTRDATVYPQQIGLACSFNPELAEVKARQTGTDARKMGCLLSLSPMVDVCRHPLFNRIEESYGEDAYLSAAFATAFGRGLQQGDLRKGVGTCSKHFLGYGGGGDADEQELMQDILMPHETMIRLAGNKVIMTGYHAIDGTKCVANKDIQQGILRDYLHFDGMMVSDYGSIDQIPGMDSDLQRGVAAFNAGNDVDFPNGTSYAYMQQALDSGLVSPQRFEQAVKNVLRYKQNAGMLDKEPVLYSKERITFDSPEERKTAYTLATQSVVLLKNDGILPLANTQHPSPNTLFLTGPNANTMWAMLGDYTFQAMRYFWQLKVEDDMHPKIVGLKEGMEKRLPKGMTLTYSRGCDWTETVETTIEEGGDSRSEYMKKVLDRKVKHPEEANEQEALSMAQQSDVIIAAVGENVMLCGESRERASKRLPGRQEEYVRKLIATGKPVVLVVFGGRAQIISDITDGCAAVIQAWYPGEEGGNAVADILYGNVSPSGKLCVSYPNTEIKDAVCYKYAGTPSQPSPQGKENIQYPFGYGLSYTTFQYSDLKLPKQIKTSDATFDVAMKVKNTGSVAADEVVQLYLDPAGLQGFARVSLQPGESREVVFHVNTEQTGHYANRQWNITPRTLNVRIGASSADIRLSGNVSIHGEAVAKPLRDKYFTETTIR